MAGFTAIAMGVGAATSLGGAAMSFTDAAKQSQARKKAEKAAADAKEDALKKLQRNVYDEIGIQKEPYRLEREAMAQAGAQATEAAVESERGAAAAAGRIYQGQQAGQADISTRMGQEMLGLEKLSAQEESRLRDLGVQMDMAELQGAQLAAADAAEREAAAYKAGAQGTMEGIQQGLNFIPLYSKSSKGRIYDDIVSAAAKKGITTSDVLQSQITNLSGKLGENNFALADNISTGDALAFRDFMTGEGVSKDQLRALLEKIKSDEFTYTSP